MFGIEQAGYAEGLNTLYEGWGEAKDENLALANRVLALADPEGKLGLGQYLSSEASGYEGNNPMLVSALYNLGTMLKEGGFIKSEVPDKKEVGEMAHRLYPNDAPKQ